MAGGARVDRRAALGIVLRDMRCIAALMTADNELGRVIVLVGGHRAAGPGIVLDHVVRPPLLAGRSTDLGL